MWRQLNVPPPVSPLSRLATLPRKRGSDKEAIHSAAVA